MIIDPFLNKSKTLYFKKFMSDSFLHNHQSALDSQREDDAIQYLEDTGVYPDPDDKFFPMETDYE